MLDRDALEKAAIAIAKNDDPKTPWSHFTVDDKEVYLSFARDAITAYLAAQGEAAVADPDKIPIAATENRDVDYVDVTGWGVFKGHAIPVSVARFIAEKVNLYAAHRTTPPASAQPVAEPVFSITRTAFESWLNGDGSPQSHYFIRNDLNDKLRVPLYTTPPASAQVVGKWEIDNSTPSPILMYEKCSVIQDEQAHYVLGLIQADVSPASGVSEAIVEALHNAKVLLKALTGPDDAIAVATIKGIEAALANGATK